MRDWKLDSLANGKETSAVPLRTEKEEYLWKYSTISTPEFPENYLTTLPSEISGISRQMVSTPELIPSSGYLITELLSGWLTSVFF